jgi:FkbM family methyltransferase
VNTPWRLPLFVDAEELHGRAMLTLGIVDLRVSEVIWRLLRPGDHAADIGANIGAIASLMAHRCARSGAVWAFEPHPETRSLLESSVKAWRAMNASTVHVVPAAVSSVCGRSWLEEPPAFATNSGIARLARAAGSLPGRWVDTVSFDSLFPQPARFKVVKIDVEGHEDHVLAGMERALSEKRIEAVVFEEFRPLPSPACAKLAEYGYLSFLIERGFRGPKLVPVSQRPGRVQGEPTNVLATIDAEISQVFRRRGWQCLAGRPVQPTRTRA